MSVTTSKQFAREKFDDLVGGFDAYDWTGGPCEMAFPKTFTGRGQLTDQQITDAVDTAAAAFSARQTSQVTARQQLATAYPTIRQWATDAATVNTNWPAMTAAQKDAAMRTTIQRLGVFLDRFGDLLQTLNADQ